MLGPNGSNFGELVYHCADCILENELVKTIEFMIDTEKTDANFNAIMSSANNKLELLFEEVGPNEIEKIEGSYGGIYDNDIKKGNKTGVRERIAKGLADSNEQTLSMKLKNKQRYRIVLQNNADNEMVKFDLRIEIIERP